MNHDGSRTVLSWSLTMIMVDDGLRWFNHYNGYSNHYMTIFSWFNHYWPWLIITSTTPMFGWILSWPLTVLDHYPTIDHKPLPFTTIIFTIFLIRKISRNAPATGPPLEGSQATTSRAVKPQLFLTHAPWRCPWCSSCAQSWHATQLFLHASRGARIMGT